MRIVAIFALLTLSLSSVAFGQDDDYKKTEFYVGYSSGQNDETSHGINVAGVYNLTRYIGAKADFSALYNSRRFNINNSLPVFAASYRSERKDYNFAGGIQIKDNSNSGRFKPFAHAMIGVVHSRDRSSDFRCEPSPNCPVFQAGTIKDTGLSGIVGGGLDIRLKNRWQLRLIQVDFNPVKNNLSPRDRSIRIGAGIVF